MSTTNPPPTLQLPSSSTSTTLAQQPLSTGSQTQTVASRPASPQPLIPDGTLHLRGGNLDDRRVQWDDGVVDNEGMGKKTSKVCCIFRKPHNPDGSDSDSDSSSSSSSSSSSNSPNAYEREPKSVRRARQQKRKQADAAAADPHTPGLHQHQQHHCDGHDHDHDHIHLHNHNA
ncbi:hypothetical protein PhCBS80983_g04626 [Powellomyces hirtus]|uniref:Type 1 phosphatases regulator n=1 Tax=Powellomyces hirtus TaxID=109895 RepID=A0A507DYS5_9FUNG|nr:hypothetical protein PhCBS80983_g04626 [Powellomyces hirtus]